MKFIRFTNNPTQDLQNKKSFNIFTNEELEGLCGFVCKGEDVEDRAKRLASWVASAYAEETRGEYAVFEGKKLEDGNDGCIFEPFSIIEEGNVFE